MAECPLSWAVHSHAGTPWLVSRLSLLPQHGGLHEKFRVLGVFFVNSPHFLYIKVFISYLFSVVKIYIDVNYFCIPVSNIHVPMSNLLMSCWHSNFYWIMHLSEQVNVYEPDSLLFYRFLARVFSLDHCHLHRVCPLVVWPTQHPPTEIMISLLHDIIN